MRSIKIFLGADHAGFELKEKVKTQFLKNFQVEDMGAFLLDKNDDYPDYAFKVAKAVAREKNSKGILVCGTGEGMCIAANKVKGIRAVAPADLYSTKMSREHNDANVLCLRARKFTKEKTKKILQVWLNTKFVGEERHKRRLRKIEKYEK